MEALKVNKVKTTPLGGKIWFSVLFFGLIGQIAWVVENMYFATLAQDVFFNSGRSDLSYIITTLMVIFSAVTATTTSIFAGGLCDRMGKRKPFISIGYILWGITIMLFGFIPMTATGGRIITVAVFLVVLDCVMTLVGSTANDAAFNAWVADVTDTTNRGKVNTLLSILPVIAVIIIFIGLGSLYDKTKETNWLFFLVLGLIPFVAGFMSMFLLKDKPNLPKIKNDSFIKDTFYGFKPSVIKENKMMYVCLAAACVVGISQQTFFSYLMNFVIETLGFGYGFVVPVAVIIVGAAVITGLCGVFYDKIGKKHFFTPLLVFLVLGTLTFFLLKFMDQGAGKTAVMYIAGLCMMGSVLSLSGALNASFQDYIPKGCEGRFQGVRMCFTVLIPMIIGPIISLGIGLDAMGMNGEGFTPPYEIFLAAAIVAVLAFIPIYFVRRDANNLRNRKLKEKEEQSDETTIPEEIVVEEIVASEIQVENAEPIVETIEE